MSGPDTTNTEQTAPRLPLADRGLLFMGFFFAVFLYLLYQLLRIMSPFLAPLLGALMICLIFFPLHNRLCRHVHNQNLAAAITTTTVLITIVLPVFLLVWTLALEASDLVPVIRAWVTRWEQQGFNAVSDSVPAPLQELWSRVLPYIERWNVDLQSMVSQTVRDLGNTLTSIGAATVRGTLRFLFNLLVLVIILFFFFRDGVRITTTVIDLVPMESHNKQLIVDRLDRTMIAIIRGGFITASAQGLLTGVGLAVAGVPFSVLLGFTAALLSYVPFLGASLIWGPASIYLLINDHTGAGIGLIVWGLLVVGLIDNFLRPYVVGRHAQLPILLLLLGILGGLQVYGLIGALIAPLVVATVLVFAQIYHDQYLQKRTTTHTAEKDSA